MNIEDFVRESLKQIISGVISAQQHAQESNAKVNPKFHDYMSQSQPVFDPKKQVAVWFGQMIEFDIAVTTVESEIPANSIRVVGGPVGLSLEGDRKESSTASHIKFIIPIFLPQQ